MPKLQETFDAVVADVHAHLDPIHLNRQCVCLIRIVKTYHLTVSSPNSQVVCMFRVVCSRPTWIAIPAPPNMPLAAAPRISHGNQGALTKLHM